MRRRSTLLIGVCLVGLALASHQAYAMGTKPAKDTICPEDEGFQMFLTPRTFDAPGKIFRVNSDKTSFEVSALSVTTTGGEETLGSGIRKVSAGFLANFISLPVKGNMNLSKNVQMQYKVEGPALREITSDVDVFKKLNDEMKAIPWQPNNDYYVMRETIAAKNIQFSFDDDAIAALGGEAVVKELGGSTIKGEVKWESKAQYQLSEKYTAPHRICYKADRITIEVGGLGGASPAYILTPVKEQIEIRNFSKDSQ